MVPFYSLISDEHGVMEKKVLTAAAAPMNKKRKDDTIENVSV